MSKPSQSASHIIERIGLGLGQGKALLASGGVWLADGSELLLISSVSSAVQNEWGLDVWQKSLIISIVYFGVLIGNLMSGVLGDMMGRRFPILLSYAGICVFSLLSIVSTGFYSMASVRFLVGISFGLAQPAYNALMGEITPSRYRLTVNGMGQCLFCLGELYSALLIWFQDPYMKNLSWRWLIGFGAIPSVIFGGLALIVLIESPSYLMVNGKREEAQRVLEQIRDGNGAADVSIDLQEPEDSTQRQRRPSVTMTEKVGIVFGRHLIYTTLVVCLSVFTLNFLFYGGLYAFPQVLPDLGLHLAPSVNLMIGAFAGIPGLFLAIFIGHYLSRRSCMLLYLLVVLASTLLFSFAQAHIIAGAYAQHLEVLLQFGLVGYKVSTAFGFLIVYVYAVEVYPTVARSTGSAMCLASGRLGAIVAPLVFEHLTHLTGGFAMFFTTIAVLCAVNATLILFLPFETKDKVLQDHLEEQQPIMPKSAA